MNRLESKGLSLSSFGKDPRRFPLIRHLGEAVHQSSLPGQKCTHLFTASAHSQAAGASSLKKKKITSMTVSHACMRLCVFILTHPNLPNSVPKHLSPWLAVVEGHLWPMRSLLLSPTQTMEHSDVSDVFMLQEINILFRLRWHITTISINGKTLKTITNASTLPTVNIS